MAAVAAIHRYMLQERRTSEWGPVGAARIGRRRWGVQAG